MKFFAKFLDVIEMLDLYSKVLTAEISQLRQYLGIVCPNIYDSNFQLQPDNISRE